ncbi:MAG: ribosome assembly cofactor RimP [Bacteroidales bacterium]|jgi:ribosome maturation factor RimP|nr:ribosome assembly cofactor RimP [Bacteroidales bacterium]MDY0198488.1 ribosome assembly cofactor RimP [Tenuifilaceae bacterium]
MISKERIESIISECIDSEKEFVVDITISASNNILVLIDSDEGISIDRCVKVSRAIEQNLDRDEEDFELEVSSAGLSSPLKVVRQYKKNLGRLLNVIPIEGEKVTGKLVDVNENDFTIEVEEMVKEEGKKRKELLVRKVTFAYKDLKSAKIVISFR